MNFVQERLCITSVTGVDLELCVAGLGGRSYAFVIDWHIRIALAIGWYGLSSLFLYGDLLPRLAGFLSPLFVYAVAAPALAIYLLYHPVLEIAMRGRTPGKRIAGVRIVTADGQTPGVGAIVIRNLLRVLDSLPGLYAVGLVTAAVTRRSVRIGDIAAGTLLVYDHNDTRAFGFEDTAIAHHGLERVELARELLSRWDALEVDARCKLAAALLAADKDAKTEADLRQALGEMAR